MVDYLRSGTGKALKYLQAESEAGEACENPALSSPSSVRLCHSFTTEPWMYLSSFSTFHFFHRQHVFFLLRTLSEWT